MRHLGALLLAVFATAASACGAAPPAPAPAPALRTLIDDSGETLVFDRVPRRIVALAPSLVEIVATIARETDLVGVSSYSDRPERVKTLPVAGSYVKPNIEAVVALRPDLVLVVMEGPPKESIDRMRALGLRVAVLRSSRVSDIPKNIRWLGAALGAEAEGESAAARVERRYAAVKAVVAGLPRPKALYAIALDPVITAGQASFIHDLIQDAGGENIAGDIEAPYPRMTLETILARAPEVILFGGEGMGSEAEMRTQRAFWSRWPTLPAVRNGGLRDVNRDLINRPSPRIAESLAEIAGILHPEKRAEIAAALGGN